MRLHVVPTRLSLTRIEAPGVDPVFPEKHQAINYAGNRSGEVRILDSTGNVERTIA